MTQHEPSVNKHATDATTPDETLEAVEAVETIETVDSVATDKMNSPTQAAETAIAVEEVANENAEATADESVTQAVTESEAAAEATAEAIEATTDEAAEELAEEEAAQTTAQPILELQHVSYAYTKGGKRVLNDISYTFETGSIYAITGPSGAGKTTLLSLISGLTTPSEGKVLYKGTDLATANRYDYRSHDIGVVFQSFNLLPSFSVKENIELSMDASGAHYDAPHDEVVRELLDEVHLPAEYANERILHLSGGEQQRVAIARALSYSAPVIVADEPTGNLDLATQDDIMDIFASLAHEQDRCVIIVTHSPQVAARADHVFELAPLRRAAKKTGARKPGRAIRQPVQRVAR